MWRALLLVPLGLLLLSPGAEAAAKKRSRKPIENSVAETSWFRYPQFSDAEVRLVSNWFRDAVAEGTQRVASIPAAIRQQFHRGAKVTENAVQALTPPPAELAKKLPPMPEGYERMLAGTIMVILKTDEKLIVDALPIPTR